MASFFMRRGFEAGREHFDIFSKVKIDLHIVNGNYLRKFHIVEFELRIVCGRSSMV